MAAFHGARTMPALSWARAAHLPRGLAFPPRHDARLFQPLSSVWGPRSPALSPGGPHPHPSHVIGPTSLSCVVCVATRVCAVHRCVHLCGPCCCQPLRHLPFLTHSTAARLACATCVSSGFPLAMWQPGSRLRGSCWPFLRCPWQGGCPTSLAMLGAAPGGDAGLAISPRQEERLRGRCWRESVPLLHGVTTGLCPHDRSEARPVRTLAGAGREDTGLGSGTLSPGGRLDGGCLVMLHAARHRGSAGSACAGFRSLGCCCHLLDTMDVAAVPTGYPAGWLGWRVLLGENLVVRPGSQPTWRGTWGQGGCRASLRMAKNWARPDVHWLVSGRPWGPHVQWTLS